MSTVKIARGASRKAEVTGTQPTGYSDRPYLSATPWPYWTLGGPGVSVTSYQGSAWNVTEDATVTVPHDAPLGAYTGTVYRNRQDTNGDGYYDSGEKVFFAFDVVCMTVKIATTEIYRDANVYRLLCTAQVQGGTAPYTYTWTAIGGTLLSGQGTATAEIEFAVGGAGTVLVNVDDSSILPCHASDSFDVCALSCDFTVTPITLPLPPPYVYECQAQANRIGSIGPYTYEWTPAPQALIEPDGRTVRISVPDNTRRPIKLTVTDSSDGCKAFKTRYVGTPGFTVSTNPGSGPGRKTGSRDTTDFTVTLKAVADADFANPPATIRFQLYRARTNATVWMSANRVVGSNPARYELDWSVRTDQGKWDITVESYPCNTVTFKIDKRKQIVEVANSWVGAAQAELGQGANCNDLSAKVYNRVGLPLSGFTNPQYEQATISCSGDGCLLFYSVNFLSEPTKWDAGHVAVEAGGQRININSLTGGPQSVTQEARTAGVQEGAQGYYKAEIRSRSTVNLDED